MLKYEDCIVFNLAKAYQSAHSRMAALFKPHGLTPIQALVLQAISEQEGQSASEISKRLLLDNATLSGVLDRLADGGWVERRADETDRRVSRIFLSDKASECSRELVQLRAESNDQILGDLSVEERVLIKRLLKDIR
ncbi:MAG: MarR family winged helix-turn-helix transcriptional regulator [Planctomycetota bacterium]|jgi:DNA-binding MarR family transcriptional regulator